MYCGTSVRNTHAKWWSSRQPNETPALLLVVADVVPGVDHEVHRELIRDPLVLPEADGERHGLFIASTDDVLKIFGWVEPGEVTPGGSRSCQ
jgi:hypothetical protein